MSRTLYACYRRPDPQTAQIHRTPHKAGNPAAPGVGLIEYTADPSFFFHSEKYRGFQEGVRIAVMEAKTFGEVEDVLLRNPLSPEQIERWERIRERALRCALWFAATQHIGRAMTISPDRFDGLETQQVIGEIRERLDNRVDIVRMIIAGSRDMTGRAVGYALIDWFVQNRQLSELGHGLNGPVDEVISGNANGGDSIGEEWAMREYIPVAHFPADWERFGKGAGMMRNEEMGKVGTHLVAFHLNNSRGTANMIDIFLREKKPYWRFTNADVSKMRDKIAEFVNSPAPGDTTFTPEI